MIMVMVALILVFVLMAMSVIMPTVMMMAVLCHDCKFRRYLR